MSQTPEVQAPEAQAPQTEKHPIMERLVDFFGFDLISPEVQKMNQSYPEYMVDTVDAKLKILPTYQQNLTHMVTGIASEIASELPHPLKVIGSVQNIMELKTNPLFSIQKNILYNLTEEVGDIIFFGAGASKFISEEGTENAFLLALNDGADLTLTELINVINSKLREAGITEYQAFREFGTFSLLEILNYISGMMLTYLKKHTVSGEKFTEGMLNDALAVLLDCLAVCISKVICDMDNILRGYITAMNITIPAEVRKIYSLGLVARVNNLKLNKRYIGQFTDEENLERDAANEQPMFGPAEEVEVIEE